MADIKTINSVPVAGIKTYQNIPLADLKTINALELGEPPAGPWTPDSIAGLQEWHKTDVGVWSRTGAYFNRANVEYLTMPSNSTIRFGHIPWAVCGWVWTPDASITSLILSKRGATAVEYQIHMAGSTVVCLGGDGAYPAATTPIVAGTWQFVVGSFDPATGGVFAIQVNNGTIAVSAAGGIMPDGTNSLGFGTDVTAPATYAMTGTLQNWALFGRALSPADRTYLYNGGAGRHYGELDAAFKTNLRAWWAFDEQDGSRVDVHNGNVLTDVNTVTSSDGLILNPASNNSPVYRWDDQSGNARHLIQTTAASRPIYHTNRRNGLPVIDFYGAGSAAPKSQWFQGSGAITVGTALSAVKNLSPLPFGNYNGWLTANSGHYFQAFYATQTYWLYGGAALGSFLRDGVADIQVDQQWHDYGVTGTPVAASGLQVGIDRGMADRVWYGPAGEILLYDTQLSDPDRVLVEEYLEERWGTFGVTPPDEIAGLQTWYKADEGVYSKSAAYFVNANAEDLTVNIATNPSLQIPSTSAWTIGGWVWDEVAAVVGTVQIEGGPNIYSDGARWRMGLTPSAGYGEVNMTGATAHVGAWHFVICGFDPAQGGGTQWGRQDNIEEYFGRTASRGVCPAFSTGLIHIGGQHTGRLQNWFLFSRYFDEADCAYIYNAGAGRSYEELSEAFKTDLRAWWPLDEQSGTRRDAHTFANHLTDVNTVSVTDGLIVNPASSNASVYQWEDQGPLALHQIQPNVAKRPSYQTNVKNGHPAVVFASGHFFSTAAPLPPSALPVGVNAGDLWAVADLTATGASNYIVQWSAGDGATQYILAFISGTWYYDHSHYGLARVTGVGAATWSVMEIHRSAAIGMQIRRNDTTLGTASPSGDLSVAPAPSPWFMSLDAPNSWIGPISEIAIYNVGLSAADRAVLRSYFNTKYALGF
jgi:hypothetical protein